jgi:hypothetical protein
MRQLNMENHFSHPRSREGGNPTLFNATDSDIRLPPSRERGFLNYSYLVAGSIEVPRSETRLLAGISRHFCLKATANIGLSVI